MDGDQTSGNLAVSGLPRSKAVLEGLPSVHRRGCQLLVEGICAVLLAHAKCCDLTRQEIAGAVR